jgi:anaerobic ribonucleoside-triphosphate reductase activating protein
LSGAPGIEGVSISGGEPFQQPEALLDLVRRIRRTPLSVLVFPGYTIDATRALPLDPETLASIDVFIAGPYRRSRRAGRELLGSANQRIHLLPSRYAPVTFATVPGYEVILHRDRTVTLSAIAVNPLPKWLGADRRLL